MNDYKYLLAIFLKCINNINLPSNINNLYTSSSNLLDLFRYNTKDMMKYIKSNVDLTFKEINNDIIDNKIRFFYNDYDLYKKLDKDIKIFAKNKSFINKLYKLLDYKFKKKDLLLFIMNLKKEYDIKNISIDEYTKIYTYLKDFVYNENTIINEEKKI
jgi:hypothetical protein